MDIHKVSLKNKNEIAKDTVALDFERPEDFTFTAGQFVRMKIIEPKETDERGDSQQFSIASAPHEDMLVVATRKGRSAFKRNLFSLSISDKVQITRALGGFTLHEDSSQPAVFLVGGIGITPVRSMLRDAVHRKLKHRFYLFCSNRRPENSAFLKEMQNINDLNYQFIGTMTKMEESKEEWEGERGYINILMLKKHIDDLTEPIYYVVGPLNFVKTMKQMLLDVGTDDSNIRREYFEGY